MSSSKYYLKAKSGGKCPTCGSIPEHGVQCDKCREKMRAYQRTYYKNNKKRYYGYEKKTRQKAFMDVIRQYGGKCAWCGETNPTYLTVDHKNEDGASRRKTEGTGLHLYVWLREHGYPTDLQLLCFNCNCAKSFRKLTKRAVTEVLWMSSMDFST